MTHDSVASTADWLHVNFNLQQDLFVAGDKTGFAVHQTDPYKETVRRSIAGGILLVELLDRTNILAIVTVRRPHCVQFWDDTATSFKYEIDLGEESIKAIRLRRDVVAVVLSKQIRLYAFGQEMKFLQAFDTIENPRGLIAISGAQKCVLAFPARRQGFLQIVQVQNQGETIDSSSGKPPAKIVIVATHSNPLGCLVMDFVGTKIATASISGTLVRLWDTTNGHQISELRRGVDKANIQSMAFSPQGESAITKLAVISDKATVHIYQLRSEHDAKEVNRKSSLAALASLGVPYFGSRWSIAQAHVEDPPLLRPLTPPLDRRFVVGWINEHLLVILSSTGGLWKYIVNKHRQSGDEIQCQQEAYRRWQVKE